MLIPLLLAVLLRFASANNLQVTSNEITYKGFEGSYGQSLFYGVPFAAPPTGPNRFKSPRPVSLPKRTVVDATRFKPMCIKLSQDTTGMSEDCLYLNILVPEGATASSNLPVILYIFGGSFTSGSPNSYNAAKLVHLGTQNKMPVIFITIEYRLAAFGWLTGKEPAQAGFSDVGLLDQRMALRWTQQNIQAFGGDPKRVLLTGQSAGAVAVALQLLMNDGDNEGLFRAAMMWSGGASTIGIGQPDARQRVFSNLLDITNCKSAQNIFDCLGQLDTKTYTDAAVKAASRLPRWTYAPQIDGSLISHDPYTLLRQGKFARVPIISGNVLDEGSIFTSCGTCRKKSNVANAVLANFPSDALNKKSVSKLIGMYTTAPSAGSPYGTGDKLFGVGRLRKMANGIVGDVLFNAPRRYTLQQTVARSVPAWSYRFDADSPNNALGISGVSHGLDIHYWFYSVQKPTPAQLAISRQMALHWLAFAYNADPNVKGLPTWPLYGKTANMQRFTYTRSSTIKDNFRGNQIKYVNDRPLDFFH